MKAIAGILFLMLSCLKLSAQTTVMADNNDEGCKIRFEKIKSKIEARRKRYEFNVQEYQDGFFCSECGRTKSEIEERAHLNFSQHIRDGATHNRHALTASQELYHNLYNEYLIDYNDLKKEYDDRYNDCGGDNASPALPTITDQQFRLYMVELHAPPVANDTRQGLFRIDYNIYQAWMATITITWWQTTTIQTTTITRHSYAETNTAENAITKAGNVLNNYAQSQPQWQRSFFLGTDTQPTWPLKGLLTTKK